MKKSFYTLLIMSVLLMSVFNNSFAQVSFSWDNENMCPPMSVNFTNTSGIDTTGVEFYWHYNGFEYYGYETSLTFYVSGWQYVHLQAFDSTGAMIGDQGSYIQVSGTADFFYMPSQACPGEKIIIGYSGNYPWNIEWFTSDQSYYSGEMWIQHAFSDTGNQFVVMVAEDECGIDSTFQSIYISPDAVPEPDIYAEGVNGSVCPNVGIQFSVGQNYDLYSWDFGDGSSTYDSKPMHSYSDTGWYSIVVMVTNKCGNVGFDTINIFVDSDLPAEMDYYYNPVQPCPGEQVQFYGVHPGNYFWDFGDGNSQSGSPVWYAYSDTGTYVFQVTYTNGCGNTDSASGYISVEQNTYNFPDAIIGFDDDELYGIDSISVCPGSEVWFRNDSWGDEGSIVFFWDFGDGNTSSEGWTSNVFDSLGDFHVMMVVSNACMNTDTAWLWVSVNNSVMPNTNLNFLPDTICPSERVYFFDDGNEGKNGGNGYIYSVWFGDGDSIVNFVGYMDSTIQVQASHQYVDFGVYPILFTATNSCGNTDSLSGNVVVDVNGAVNPFYYVYNSTINYNNGGGPLSLPDFGQSSGSNEHTFDMDISYAGWSLGMNENSYVIFWYGGSDVLNGGDNGPPDGIITLTGEGPTTGYVPVENDSVFIAGLWYCGEPFKTEPDGFAIIGAYALSPGGYNDLGSNTITIVNSCDSVVPAFNESASCPGDVVTFGVVGGISYVWHFNDGTTDTNQFTYHLFPDTGLFDNYVVILTGCGTYDTVHTMAEIRDYNIPNGYVDWYKTGSCDSDPIEFFYGNNNGGDDDWDNNQYFWKFGDGSTSTERNPVHAFSTGGNVNVSLTVTNGCGSNTWSFDMYIDLPQISTTVFNGCFGEEDAQIYLNVSNASFPVTYQWNNGATDAFLSGVAHDTYSVTITEDDGCSVSETFLINEPDELFLFTDVTPVSCFGANDGSVSIYIDGGTPPYYYNWSTGGSTNEVFGLPQNSYYVTVTDMNGCTVVDSAVINEPDELIVVLVGSNPLCAGDWNGSIDMTVTGGITPYYITWSTGEISMDISDLSDGYYTVDVNDANGCNTNDTIYMNEPAAISSSYMVYDALCYGGNDGSIDYLASGGIPMTMGDPYLIIWSNGDTIDSPSGLTAGQYTVVVSDSNNCEYSETIWVSEQLTPFIITTNSQDAACMVSDGIVWVENISGGGTGPFNYEWNTAPSQYIDTANNVGAGTYEVIVTSQEGCSAIATVTVSNAGAAATDSVSTGFVTCNGDCDGDATAYISGGVEPYEYLWSSGDTVFSITNLCEGLYFLTVTDSNSCIEVTPVYIGEPDPISIQVIGNDLSCFNSGDGAINLSVEGGTQMAFPNQYSYLWLSSETTYELNGLASGTYSCTVTDSLGCLANTGDIFVDEPSQITASFVTDDVTCNGYSNGMIDLTVSGEHPPFGYTWSNSFYVPDMTGLSAGWYVIDIQDGTGCIASDSVEIFEPTPVAAVVDSWTDVSCFGDCDGTATVTASGGTSPYYYLWSAGFSVTSATNSGLCEGFHIVTVTDDNDCSVNAGVTIYQPDKLKISLFSEDDVDNQCIGSASVVVSGGTPPYYYLWNGSGQTTDTIVGLCTGGYSVTVTDVNMCFVPGGIFVDISLSVISISEESDITVFPNPSNDGKFTVAMSLSTSSRTTIEVIDLTGRQVYRENLENGISQTSIDLGSKATGMYTVRIISNDAVETVKLVISK